MAHGISLVMREIHPKQYDPLWHTPNVHRRTARAVAKDQGVSVRRVKRAVKAAKIRGLIDAPTQQV